MFSTQTRQGLKALIQLLSNYGLLSFDLIFYYLGLKKGDTKGVLGQIIAFLTKSKFFLHCFYNTKFNRR